MATSKQTPATTAAARLQPASQRLVYLDLFRGLAVFFMFDAHVTDAVIHLGTAATRLHHWHNLMFNLPAPAFLFAAGLSFGMAVYARWDQFRGWSRAVRSRLGRLGEVLFIAYLLHVPATSLSGTLAASEGSMRRFLGWDILQCIGYTSVLLLLIALAAPRREWFLGAAALLTLAVTFSSAYLWDIRWAEQTALTWWVATIFSKQLGSNFPFFPYAAFLGAGAVWGYLYSQAREAGGEHSFLVRTFWGGCALLAVFVVLCQVPLPAPFDDFWGGSPIFFFLRVGLLSALLAGLYFVERRLLPALNFIVLFGRESLIVYFVHLIIVYGSPLNGSWNFQAQFRAGTGFWGWLLLLGGITALMAVLAYAWSAAKQRFGAMLDRVLWIGGALAALGFAVR